MTDDKTKTPGELGYEGVSVGDPDALVVPDKTTVDELRHSEGYPLAHQKVDEFTADQLRRVLLCGDTWWGTNIVDLLDARCKAGAGPTAWETAKDRRIAELEAENKAYDYLMQSCIADDGETTKAPPYDVLISVLEVVRPNKERTDD